jgi:hypothetical protein
MVWLFNIFGTTDLLTAITLATIYNAPIAMGPAYWIPAVAVPLLLVTHYVTFILLWRHWEWDRRRLVADDLGKRNGVVSKHLTFASREIVHFNGFNSPSSCRKEEARRKN